MTEPAKMGRPRASTDGQERTERLPGRYTPAEAEWIAQRAAERDQTAAQWVRARLLRGYRATAPTAPATTRDTRG